jgi:hypothetical protein
MLSRTIKRRRSPSTRHPAKSFELCSVAAKPAKPATRRKAMQKTLDVRRRLHHAAPACACLHLACTVLHWSALACTRLHSSALVCTGLHCQDQACDFVRGSIMFNSNHHDALPHPCDTPPIRAPQGWDPSSGNAPRYPGLPFSPDFLRPGEATLWTVVCHPSSLSLCRACLLCSGATESIKLFLDMLSLLACFTIIRTVSKPTAAAVLSSNDVVLCPLVMNALRCTMYNPARNGARFDLGSR